MEYQPVSIDPADRVRAALKSRSPLRRAACGEGAIPPVPTVRKDAVAKIRDAFRRGPVAGTKARDADADGRESGDRGDDTGIEHGAPPARAPGSAVGEVYLVGAGPGDPELLTLRAVRLMQQADVVVHDHLIGDGILDLVPRTAQRIYVGKEARNHTLPQDDINDLLVRLAQQGKRVLRLKGGDPFIFGRGGEEIATLAAHGIRFQVVPGVTAAAGAAAYAGIPLTHRDCAHACVFATGHLKDGSVGLDWAALARRDQTVVIYMGLGGLAEICRELVLHGLPDDWPAAVVENATMQSQRVVTGSLCTLPHLAQAAAMRPPSLVIVGEVVKLRRQLEWFAPAAVSADEAARGAG
jgi:uroporphyrin-III C-methyltransferase/precorrin-2 dehydrogenase/sirohydrochlorin ferrochelatase